MNRLFDLGQEALGITFSESAKNAFYIYANRLIETNKVMNLTAITEPEQVYIRHFIDSAAVLSADDFKGKSLIDVGCGAGFPGLPIKITEPSVSLTLLDSLGKRISFLDELCSELKLGNIECIHGRAEEEALKEDRSLAKETIAIVFFKDEGLKRSQQMFADLNKHAVKSTMSLSTLYDDRDYVGNIVKDVVARIPFLNKYNNLFAMCTLWCYIIRKENKNEFISKNKILAVQKEH